MSVVKRIKQYIDYKGITNQKFEQEIGYSNGAFATQLKKNKEIGSGKLENILIKYPEINPEWLLIGSGEMLRNRQQNIEQEYKKEQYPKVVTIDKQGKDNIILVPIYAQAGYLSGYDNPTFIENLPTYSLPSLRNGVFRMFEVKGHSMTPTLHQGSYIVGQFVENWKEDIKDDRIYIIVSAEDGVVVKRCLNRIEKYNSIFCKSDNRTEFPSYSINPHDIKEIWEVKLALLSNLPNPADIFNRINDLEADMIYLKERTNNL